MDDAWANVKLKMERIKQKWIFFSQITRLHWIGVGGFSAAAGPFSFPKRSNGQTTRTLVGVVLWRIAHQKTPTQANKRAVTHFIQSITLHHYLFIVELFSIPFKRKRLQRDCCDLRDVWDFSGLLTLNFVDWILKRIDFPSCLIWLIPFVVCDKKFWIPSFLGRISSFNQKANLLTDLCVSPFKEKTNKQTIHTKMNMSSIWYGDDVINSQDSIESVLRN